MDDIADDHIDQMLGFGRGGWRGMDDEDFEAERRQPKCNRCGATDVRWRQQTGRWVLFSLKPGVVHRCEIDDSDFDVVPDDDEEQLW